ncbi:MAG: hypothetical protein V1875_04575 [Candidatus Altiarchaeota archaeon]
MRHLMLAAVLACLLCGCLEQGSEPAEGGAIASTSSAPTVPKTEPTAAPPAAPAPTTSTSSTSTVTSSTFGGVCPKGYVRAVVGCCVDMNGNGLCDRAEKATTTTSTINGGFARLFEKVDNRTPDIPLQNGTSVNEGLNYPATSSTLIEGITPAYQNRYNIIDLGPDSDERAENSSGCMIVREGGRILMYCPLKNATV